MSSLPTQERRKKFLTGATFLWNSPNTALGLLAGVGGRYAWHADSQAWEVTGGWLIECLGRMRLADAITLGDVILYADPALIFLLREHETVHVHQYRAWGPLFLPAYLAESLYQYLRTGDGYHRNRFEIAAYQADRRRAGDEGHDDKPG